MLKDQYLLMRRNLMTPDEREQMASLNTKFHGAILHMVADFTKSEKGSIRPFLLTIGQGYKAQKHFFSSLDQLAAFAEKRVAKENHIISELDKMRVMLKMYDLGDRYVINRQERKGLRPFSVKPADPPGYVSTQFRYQKYGAPAARFFDSLETLWFYIHGEIKAEQARIASLEEQSDA